MNRRQLAALLLVPALTLTACGGEDDSGGGSTTQSPAAGAPSGAQGGGQQPGTEGGGGVTRVGDDGLFMAGAHVAHDCQIGNRVILVNNASVAGHCILEDDVIVGGLSGVHQFVRIGRGAMIGAVTMVTADVIPYGLVQGPRGHLDGLNVVGLRRHGATRDDIHALRDMLHKLGEGSFRDTARHMAEQEHGGRVRDVLDFILGPSDRSFLAPHQ